MNSQESTELVVEQDEAFVADYLYRNRDFFTNNQHLLTRISIPHESGKAISLVERQLGLYREKCNNLESHLNELVGVAKTNEELGMKLNSLACDIISSKSMQELQSHIAETLHTEYAVDRLALHLLDGVASNDYKSTESYGQGELAIVRDSMGGRDILCGRINNVQRVGLFGEHAVDIESAALVWLKTDKELGLMALGSTDAEKFSSEKGTVFLKQLSALVSSKVTTLAQ